MEDVSKVVEKRSRPALLDETQSKNLVRAICSERQYMFYGWEGAWVGSRTKLQLKCSVGHKWNTNTVSNLKIGRGCPVCSESRKGATKIKPTSQAVEEFLATGCFHKDSKFWKTYTDKGSKSRWSYTCGVCSLDAYVQNGLCTGVFSSTMDSLRQGYLNCRCSAVYRWNEVQLRYKIESSLLQRGGKVKFVSFVGDFAKSGSTVKLSCSIHGEWTTSYISINVNQGCPCCAESGFDKLKEVSCIYVIKARSQNNSFTGFGISSNLKSRLCAHKVNLKKSGYSFTDLVVFETTGQNAFDIEASIKQTFPIVKQGVVGFKTEAVDGKMYASTIDFIKAKLFFLGCQNCGIDLVELDYFLGDMIY